MRCRSMLAASFTVFALAGISADSNWPQFRGSQAGIAADDPALPETWSSTENIGWKARCAWRRVGLARRLGAITFS